MKRLLVLLALSLFAFACTPQGGTDGAPAKADRPDRGNKLVIGIQQEPDKLNTMLNAMVYGTYINQTIHGYFGKFDETMELVPELIEEVPTLANGGISADGLTITYRLRQGVSWHDGQPFTAADVVFTRDAIMDDNHPVESRLPYERIERIETPDDHTVVCHLDKPYAPFVTEMLVTSHMMPKHLLEEHVGIDFSSAPWHRAPVGLGPFMFKEWKTGSHVTVVRNENYFRGAPALEEIQFRFIPDSNTLFLELQTGGIDLMDSADTDKHERLEALPGVSVTVTPSLSWEHLDLNHEDPVLADVRVRRAIQFAVNREQISEAVYDGLWPAALGDMAEELPWFNEAVREHVRHDPDAARAELDAAGWTMGRGGIREKDGKQLILGISTTAGRQLRVLTEEVIQQQLAEVGIKVQIQNHQSTVLFAPYESNGVLKRGRYQIGMYAWITSPDPNRHNLYHSSRCPPPSGQNHPRYRSARMDELLEAGLVEMDPAKRKAIYDEVQLLLATDIPMTPLVWRASIDAFDSRLQGYKPNPTQVGDTWNTWEWSLAGR